jgi:hypothetical protein
MEADCMTEANESNRLPILAAQIRRAHAEVQEAAKTAAEHAIEAGHALMEAKTLVKHGGWLPWLKEHCALAERTAQAYVQLARRHAEMDAANAQRVAGLPVRKALKAIAESRPADPLPPLGSSWAQLWAWAGKQIEGPFNRFDLDHLSQLRRKLIDRAGVPSLPAFLLTEKLSARAQPVLRMVEIEDLQVTAKCLVPWTTEEHAERIEIDTAGMDFVEELQLRRVIRSYAMWLLGRTLNELEYRERFDSYEAWQRESKMVERRWLNCP